MNAPKLRFKEFNYEWGSITINDIVDKIIDNRGKNPPYYVESGIPIIDNYLIKNQRYLTLANAKRYIDRNLLETFIRKEIIENDLLITLVGNGMGSVTLAPKEESVIIQNTLGYRFKSGYNQIFMFYLIQFYNKSIKKLNREMAQPNLKQSDLNALNIKIPTFNEQYRISTFFSEVDSMIGKQEEKIELLKLQKKGLMQKIFSQELRFKGENGQEYPEWKTYKLAELVAFFKGQVLSKSDLASEGVPCVLYGQLYTIYGEIIDKVISKTQNNSGFNGEIGDVLIPSSGETAIDIACASALNQKALLGGDLNVLRPNKNLANGNFLAYLLSNVYKNELSNLAQGATVVHLYNNSLKSLLINLPIIEEQQKIADTLICLDKKIKKETDKVSELAIQKQAFMQQMFI